MKKDQHSRKRTHLSVTKVAFVLFMVVLGTFAFNFISKQFTPRVVADSQMNIWWPTNNAKVSGLQPFKAEVRGKNVSEYDMTWSVDGGQQNTMSDSMADAPHKEAPVDLTSWTWKGSGPYKVTFRATDKSGAVIGESSVDIYGPEAATGPRTVVVGTTTQPTSSESGSSVLSGTLATISGVQQVAAQNTPTPTSIPSAFVSVIAPATESTVTGVTSFKANVANMIASEYSMYWQVDFGQKNDMQSGMNGNQSIKEASVDVSSWNWRGTGPYKITFTAEKNGQKIGTSEISIYTGAKTAITQTSDAAKKNQAKTTAVVEPVVTPAPTPTVTPVQEVTQAVAGNPLSGMKFFVNPNSNAKRTADEWRTSRPNDAFQMDKIANSPEAIWLGGWNSNVQQDVANKIAAAKAQGAAPVFIAYNIPNRDCGSYSAGGVSNGDAYRSWIKQIAAGISGNKAVVVVEPDSLTSTDCLNASQKADRFGMISDAVSILKGAGATVYLDAGHSSWVAADEMANRLNSAGIAKADGFALNVSNFQTTQSNIDFGTKVSAKVGGKHFIVDTARNGVGPAAGNEWCNPSGRALGNRATANTGNSLVDAFLWLKNPGESDGNCNGGPSAGVWWPEYALGLAQRSAF
jgi:endoglucanase